jgi:hypothetical protein
MTNKNRTAVEFLYERLESMIPRTILYTNDKKEFFQQALAIEKEQIINSWNDSHISMMSGEQYYKETYEQ